VPPHQTPHHLIETLHEMTLTPPRRDHDGDAVYALIGLAILVTVLFLTSGTWG